MNALLLRALSNPKTFKTNISIEIASLTAAAASGDWWLFSIKYDPAFDQLRGDPRFQELLRKFDPTH